MPIGYSYIALSGLFFQDRILTEKLWDYKKNKGIIYVLLGTFTLLDVLSPTYSLELVMWLSCTIAFCEGITNIMEYKALQFEKGVQQKLELMKQNGSPLKEVENLIMDSRIKLELIQKHSKIKDINGLRKAFYELNYMLRNYHEADSLVNEVREVVFELKYYDEEKIVKLLDQLEESLKW